MMISVKSRSFFKIPIFSGRNFPFGPLSFRGDTAVSMSRHCCSRGWMGSDLSRQWDILKWPKGSIPSATWQGCINHAILRPCFTNIAPGYLELKESPMELLHWSCDIGPRHILNILRAEPEHENIISGTKNHSAVCKFCCMQQHEQRFGG